ncbi:LOG family protein [Candidatus Poribacteria bacterium]|nr:LOG family protein [Candidatus Poribacteria bacterium]
MKSSEKIVTIFGSSQAQSEDKLYNQAYHLGKLLADSGFIVCNGGYSGIMEASSRGAKESGGKTIGITVDTFLGKTPNHWNDIEIMTSNYIERLRNLLTIADAFVVLKGGIGTLTEMALVWSSITIGELNKPFLLMGKEWKEFMKTLPDYLMIRDGEENMFSMVETAEEVVVLLKKLLV